MLRWKWKKHSLMKSQDERSKIIHILASTSTDQKISVCLCNQIILFFFLPDRMKKRIWGLFGKLTFQLFSKIAVYQHDECACTCVMWGLEVPPVLWIARNEDSHPSVLLHLSDNIYHQYSYYSTPFYEHRSKSITT